MPPRILILTATVGEGHDLPARTLADQLRASGADPEIVVEDALEAMGPVVKAVSADAATVVFFRAQWVWDVAFWLFARWTPSRLATQALLTRVGRTGLLRLIDRTEPDVIVSTYPNVTEVLGRLRRSGRLGVPVCSAITDLAALRYWAHRGVDVHLIAYPDSLAEVYEIAGLDAEVRCVHGLTRPEFRARLAVEDARRALRVAPDRTLVLVSGGGWGVGDVVGAVATALAIPDADVACLCGRNEALRATVARRFAGEPRVRIEGFTEQMHTWLCAADVLVHSTAGLTVLEALLCGCPPISYGWGRGHIRLNNAAFRRFGLADVVESRSGLEPALHRALRGRRAPDPRFTTLPAAADLILRAANRRA